MDADAIGPILTVGGTALALLGRRRRASQDSPTVGERLSDGASEAIDAVAVTAQKIGTGISDLSVTGTAAVMRTTVTGAAGVVRVAGHAAATVLTGVVELVGHGASRSGGLVLDGGVFLIDGLVEPMRGRHRTPSPQAAHVAAVTSPVGQVTEPPTSATKAPARKVVAKKAAARQAPAKKSPSKRAPAKKAPAKKAPAKKVVAKKAATRRPPAK